MMEVLTPPIGKTSTCLTPCSPSLPCPALPFPSLPFPALTTFCRLEELGLEAVGQRLEPDRAVLARRVVEPDDWCRRLGAKGCRGTRSRAG
jgi:hypothetical protein